MFYFNQFFKNLILIRFKGIEAKYLYVYQTNFIFLISHMNCFLHFILIWNVKNNETLWYKKASENPKNKMI
jgi:hypothetical protein